MTRDHCLVLMGGAAVLAGSAFGFAFGCIAGGQLLGAAGYFGVTALFSIACLACERGAFS